jgi:NAD(P)-dependent dehydrogenase (short-subunit alcohol dehydrogenase family)
MGTNSNRAVIIGASGGIGSALARLLHAQGFSLFLVARSSERLQALAEELGASWTAADGADSAQVDAAFAKATDGLGGVNAVAHCVGSILLKPAHQTADAEWNTTLALNLSSAFYVTRAAVRAMSGTGGSIALISSVAARIGLANHEAIAAAKAGVQGLALSAAATYASRGIRVNVVAPGLVDTPLAARITGNEAALKASTALHPLGRIGRADDVARALAWLLHPDQNWVTGQVLGVDGGLATVRGR